MCPHLALAAAIFFGTKAEPKPEAKPEMGPPLPAVSLLIEQMESKEFDKREDAVKLLEAIGPRALRELRLAKNHVDPEVRRHVNRLILEMEAKLLLAPKRISLQAKKMPNNQVLEEFRQQTGFKIEINGALDNKKAIDLECADEPFWKAFDRFCQINGLMLQQSYNDDTIRLIAQDRFAPFVVYDGAFRVVANNLVWTREVDLSAQALKQAPAKPIDELSFGFVVCAEPKLPILQTGPVRLEAVYDDESRSMIPQAEEPGINRNPLGRRRVTRYYGGGYPNIMHQSELTLVKPSEESKKIKQLKGVIPVTLLVERKLELVFDNIAASKGKKNKVGLMEFTIQKVTETPAKQLQVELLVTNGNKENGNDYTWLNTMSNRLEIHDDKGTKYVLNQWNWINNTVNSAHIEFTFTPPASAKPGAVAKLQYQNWVQRQHEVHFEFKDLPLP